MLNIGLIALTLCGADILVQPFRIADAEPGHHQTCVRTAMAPDGHFAIAWRDSVPLTESWLCELDLYIRFFDSDGSPLTDAYKITKAADTNLIGGSHLDMDSAGSTVLIWTEYPRPNPNDDLLRLQLFDTSGSAIGSHQTDHQGYISWCDDRAVAVSLNDQGEFAIVWDAETICARRYSLEGGPQGDPFRVHDDLPDGVGSDYPGVALSDAGDLVVTWHEHHNSGEGYPRFQAFDAEDEPILGWEPMGHRVDDGEELYNGTRSEVYWLDNDRFVVFWRDNRTGKPGHYQPVGRVFSDRGLTRHPIRAFVTEDTLWLAHGGPEAWYSTALAPNDSFAYTHIRTYTDHPDTSDPSKKRAWEHGGGILGYIQNNEPIRRTNLFEYTPPLGADTVNSYFNGLFHPQPPAVACCNDRIVWVYSRLNTDTIFEAYAMITDWDMGVGVEEQPIPKQVFHWELVTSIGPQIVLRYTDRPDGFHASVFDATGRKVDEINATRSSGTISWGEGRSRGVYFIREESSYHRILQKIILVQ
jgi:hypothetical protein